MSKEIHQVQLEKAFQFSHEDLLLNQANVLSHPQQERLAEYSKVSRTGARFALITFGVLIAPAWWFAYFSEGPGIDQARPFS